MKKAQSRKLPREKQKCKILKKFFKESLDTDRSKIIAKLKHLRWILHYWKPAKWIFYSLRAGPARKKQMSQTKLEMGLEIGLEIGLEMGLETEMERGWKYG